MSNFGNSFFHTLENKQGIALPQKFTFPFYYEPHPLSLLAAEQLQQYLVTQNDFEHNFGLNPKQKGLIIGKMFGVMVVKNTKNELGYLAAFSGKLADSNHIKGFVPTVYNTLNEAGFYKKGEAELNTINNEIEILEEAQIYKKAQENVLNNKIAFAEELEQLKEEIKAAKRDRNKLRDDAKNTMSAEAYMVFVETLSQQSIGYQIRLKHFKIEGEQRIQKAEAHLNGLNQPIQKLKTKRANLSASLQKRIHEQYRFLNSEGNTKDLLTIFKDTTALVPPAGSGECAAPKLFQYAYENDLKPICMAEFWWGASPKSEVRKHQQFYPSCRSKCEPILGHMMQGLLVDENPIEAQIIFNQALDIVYEDDHLLLVNKPHEFLSVPGKNINESVLSRMKAYLPNATGPLLLHRLDMSTSGLLLVAKSNRVYKHLQKQFIERSIKKRYIALLDGVLPNTEGSINLPLRVDLDNRPQQLVCYTHGKPATTNYQVITIENGKTRVYFYPITGRTHQLRVHAAHSEGLKTPIMGDDLYGTKANRLHLHAESITFMHPITKEVLTVRCEVPF
ncbi:tRNA pseudouridine32 synthase/23S rRNA pseudouridine746 synthase [Mariniflexile fucanivorans]|uniref:tRNA pseudouridine32 synthase/23S rRNA pseudouridine746 synthase n=1 Tax=Mariniflexile fucanivorans TaxID=264023 RepID=A0A4R1RNE5_9FLAO|nr:pseudouridine synthase [Mariniflexile fucanivorans]TCL67669.1 tRNA pseudouridine32 synthase/23S rRNA pseudouridine746 synthase [Mariniflexile fucanivorans]